MSDIEDDGMKKFESDPDDDIRPIDVSPPHKPMSGDAGAEDGAFRQEIPEEVAQHMFDNEQNILEKGDYIDLFDKTPGLREVRIGVGWDQKAVEEDMADLDISLFLLDKNDETRIDEDFVFYNNAAACDGAIKHEGDNRTGAGDGDDETVFIDLNGVPFDVLKIMFVLSVYDEDAKGYNLGLARQVYIRLVNKEDGDEILRYPVPESELEGQTGILLAGLIREGPKWYFEVFSKAIPGGLAAAATDYGIIVQEQTG